MIHRIENETVSVDINNIGAELWSFKSKLDNTEHLWQGDKKFWDYKACALFPICGNVRKNKMLINGTEYDMPMHGFLRLYEHKLIEKTDNMLRFRFKNTEETLKIYPYTFCVDTIFKLEDNTLSHSFEITNSNNCSMPFSIGYHPGFMCPFDNKHSYTDYRLKFEKKEDLINLTTPYQPIERQKPDLFDCDTIDIADNVFLPTRSYENLRSKWVQLEEKDTLKAIRVDISNCPTINFWSVAENLPFVCIEPWYANFEHGEDYGEFANKKGLVHLEPAKTFSCSIKISLERS